MQNRIDSRVGDSAVELRLLSTQKDASVVAVSGTRQRQTQPKERDHDERAGTGYLPRHSGTLVNIVILVLNLVVVAIAYGHFGVTDQESVWYTGKCSTAHGTVTGAHLLINIISTVVILFSNYGMQCVSAPTRKEIDKAHQRKKWLSIGVPNVRNIFFVAPYKSALWILLCFTSLPLHLLWNSTVFLTQSTNNYLAVAVTQDFLTGSDWNATMTDDQVANLTNGIAGEVSKLQDMARAGMLTRLNPSSCITTYGVEIQDSSGSVLLVMNDTTSASSSLLSVYDAQVQRFQNTVPFVWMCSAAYDTNSVMSGGAWNCLSELKQQVRAGQAWVPGQSPDSGRIAGSASSSSVLYCLSDQTAPQNCKVSIVPVFVLLIAACNIMKAIVLALILKISAKQTPLVFMGDAIESFLARPDEYTKRRCLAAKYDYDCGWLGPSKEWQYRPPGIHDTWCGGRHRWGKALRNSQWVFYMLSVSTAIMCAGAFYGPYGLGSGTTESGGRILDLGIGLPHENYYLSDDLSVPLLSGFFFANIAQLIVVYVYLGLNNMMATMLSMAEYCNYGQHRKGLRVSQPAPDSQQRPAYRFGMPIRWAIPILVSSALLHFFVSQMVFLSRINVYDFQGRFDSAASTTNIFFSPLAMVLSVSVGSAIVVCLIVLGIFKKYPENIPLAGCCSASLAAACQPKPGEDGFSENMSLCRLQWGVIDDEDRTIGHATFSEQETVPLEPGCVYA